MTGFFQQINAGDIMKSIFISLTAAAYLAVFAGLASGDTIEPVEGRLILRVRIQEEGIKNVIYDKGSLKNQTIASDRVKSITYHSTAPDYNAAVEAFKTENYGAASNLYEEYGNALGDSKKALQAHCMYMAARCKQLSADFSGAINGYARFANEFKEHRLYPDALRKRAICYISSGDREEARKAFVQLQQAIDRKGFGDFWKYEVEYWLLYLNERSDLNRSMKAYQDLFKKVDKKYPEVANKARLRIGRVMMQQKKYKESISYFDAIIDERMDLDREVVAGAYMNRGVAKMNQQDRPTEEDFKSALYDLLRVVVHYKDIGSPQAEAMYFAGKCFQNLGGKDSAKRWQGLYRRLTKEWPGSEWAKDAAAELGA
jgi:TolA-binding protein